jgi:hypothetical protein
MNNADMPAVPAGKIDIKAPKGGDPFGNYTINALGLTKREHFAGLAMQGLLTDPVMGDSDLHPNAEEWQNDITGCSLEFADILLAKLDKVVAK